MIALLKAEPAANQVELLLRSGDARISTVNLAEVVDVLVRRDGFAHAEIRDLLDPLIATDLAVVAADVSTAWAAADVRARHYRRRGSALSMADCFAIATSSALGSLGRLATADAVLADVARTEGVDVLRLPNSQGRLS